MLRREMADDSFASLMKKAGERGVATGRRLHAGDVVQVRVMQISGDSVFVDAGTPGDGRIPRAELADENGEMLVAPGALLDAVVVDPSPDRPRFTASRRAILEERRRSGMKDLLARLQPGTDLDATVRALNKHGAVVDLGGLDGFIHISELARHRVERPEDVVQPGELVKVRVLSVEESDKGPRVRLSRKALEAPSAAPAPAVDEVLKARVVGATNGGLTVSTAKGEGYLPLSELGMPPGGDHRRAFPPGKELDVVLVSNAGARPRFSATQVARVEERKNFRDYSKGAAPDTATGFGQLGDLLRRQLGLPNPPPEPPATPERADPRPPVSPPPRPTAAVPAPRAAAAPGPATPPTPRGAVPPRSEAAAGVVRRKRP
jgi:small subunit ribosomal protein S1